MSTSFNLVHQPWIRVVRDGQECELSLTDVFLGASDVTRLAGELATQDAAVTRLLLAIMYRALDLDGDPVERWRDLWDRPDSAAEELVEYLQAWEHRFDLFDDAAPFYQVAGLERQYGGAAPVHRLIPDFSDDMPLFVTRSASSVEAVSFAEAARWLVHHHSYDPCGIRGAVAGDARPGVRHGRYYGSSQTVLNGTQVTLLESDSLWRTLLLNFPLTDTLVNSLSAPPAWERTPRSAQSLAGGFRSVSDYTVTAGYKTGKKARTSPAEGVCDYLTWQSRWVRLVADDELVTGVVTVGGDERPFALGMSRPYEPHLAEVTVSPPNKPDGIVGLRASADMAFCRSIPTVAAHPLSAPEHVTPPRSMTWFARLHTALATQLPDVTAVTVVGTMTDKMNTIVKEVVHGRVQIATTDLGDPTRAVNAAGVAVDLDRALRRCADWADAVTAGTHRGASGATAITTSLLQHLEAHFARWAPTPGHSYDRWRTQATGLIRRAMNKHIASTDPAQWLLRSTPQTRAAEYELDKALDVLSRTRRTAASRKPEKTDRSSRTTTDTVLHCLHKMGGLGTQSPATRRYISALDFGDDPHGPVLSTLLPQRNYDPSAYDALRLYARHVRAGHAQPHTAGVGLGTAARTMVLTAHDDPAMIAQHRVVSLLADAAKTDRNGTFAALRSIISLLAAHAVSLDYGTLARDITTIHGKSAGASHVVRKWERQYFQVTNAKATDPHLPA